MGWVADPGPLCLRGAIPHQGASSWEALAQERHEVPRNLPGEGRCICCDAPSICPSLPATCCCGSGGAGAGPGRRAGGGRVPGAESQEPGPRSRAPAARALSPKRLGFTERHQNSRVCAGPLTACQGFEWAGVVGCWSRLLRFEPTPGKGGREQLRGGGGESAKSLRPPPAHTSGSGAEASAAPGRPLPARRCPDLVWGSLGC